VEELNGAYGVQKRYVYGLDLISMADVLAGKTYYYGYDVAGSTRLLTDEAGDIAAVYDYDAFGTLIYTLNLDPGTLSNPCLFHGEWLDVDLGLYYLRARWMSTDIGRFWSMDEFEGMHEDPLSLHKYTFTANNPVNMTDPSGYYAGAMTLGGISTTMHMQSIMLYTAAISAAILQTIMERFDQEIPLFHYTTEESFTLIKLTGVIMPSVYSGRVFFTKDEYSTGEMALQRLALVNLEKKRRVPNVRISIVLKRFKDGVLGPTFVMPEYVHETGRHLIGGGTQYYTIKMIPFHLRKHDAVKIPPK